jgi:hypothetical protein
MMTSLSASAFHQQARGMVERVGPSGAVGIAAGAQLTSLLLDRPHDIVMMLAATALIGALPAVFMQVAGFIQTEVDSAERSRFPVGAFAQGCALSLFAYGPLVLYAALVKEVASSAWIGGAMAAYAAGALLGPRLARSRPHASGLSAVIALGAVSVGVWVFAFSGVSMVIARFVTGAFAFGAQGRLLRRIASMYPGSAGAMATFAGLGVGAGASSAITGLSASQLGVQGMGAVLASAGFGCAILLAALHRHRATGG